MASPDLFSAEPRTRNRNRLRQVWTQTAAESAEGGEKLALFAVANSRELNRRSKQSAANPATWPCRQDKLDPRLQMHWVVKKRARARKGIQGCSQLRTFAWLRRVTIESAVAWNIFPEALLMRWTRPVRSATVAVNKAQGKVSRTQRLRKFGQRAGPGAVKSWATQTGTADPKKGSQMQTPRCGTKTA